MVGQLSPSLQSAVKPATADGASSWLSARPIDQHGFALHKGAFRDAVALLYEWEPANLASHCDCGVSFDSIDALTHSRGGMTIVRQSEILDIIAHLISKVCSDVEIEPKLQFLHASANRRPKAGLDMKARGFWGGAFECALFHVRVLTQAHAQMLPNPLLLPCISTTGADETPCLWAEDPRCRNVLIHTREETKCLSTPYTHFF